MQCLPTQYAGLCHAPGDDVVHNQQVVRHLYCLLGNYVADEKHIREKSMINPCIQ